jgi:hypothetical protein
LLRERVTTGAQYSVHTNGVLALRKRSIFNQYDRACISFPSFLPATYEKMMGTRSVPDLAAIITQSRIPVKVSCVVNEHNVREIDSFLERCRQIGVQRLVLRNLYGQPCQWQLPGGLPIKSHYRGNPVHDFHGMEVTCWDFDLSASTSINLFADGTLGTSYVLAHTPEFLDGIHAKNRS